MWQDLTFAARRLWHTPGFLVIAVLTLTVAIGANTAILSVADAVLFRPLPYRDPDRVFLLQMANRETGRRFTLVSHEFLGAIERHHEGVGPVGMFGSGPRVWADSPNGVEEVPTLATSASYFHVLGITPAHGRLFAEGDTPRRSAMLSYGSWRTRFGGDPSVVGRTLTIGTSSFDIVGVLPSSFVFPSGSGFIGKPEIITLMAPVAAGATGGTFHPIVRLEPGVTREQAQAEILALSAPIADRDARTRGTAPVLEDIRSTIYPVGRPVMTLLLVAAGFVLLIGCANLANMLLARGRAQERDTAVRAALGAGRVRIVRPIVLEAAIIGVVSAVLALTVTAVTFDLLLQQVPSVAYGNAPTGVDYRVVSIGLALGVAGAALVALVPAWRSSKFEVLALLQGRYRSKISRARLGRPMIALQAALAVILVFGAVVVTRAFVAVLNVPLGFSAADVAQLIVTPPQGIKDLAAFYRQVVEQVAARPEVVAAGATGTPPLGGNTAYSGIRNASTKETLAGLVHVMPGYFEAIGIRLLQGRTLTWDDAPAASAAVVSESAERVLFPGRGSVGRTLEDGSGGIWNVVGVVADVRSSLDRESAPTVYVIPKGRTGPMVIFARVRLRQEAVVLDLKRAAGTVAPVPVSARWWEDSIAALTSYQNPRFQTLVLTGFAAMALALTALGVFGVVSFLVASRVREMAVRLAIGANPGSLVKLVVREVMVPATLGLFAGLLATRWVAQVAESQFFKVDANDPVAFGAAAAVVIASALVAAWLPARRAARIDPIMLLKAL